MPMMGGGAARGFARPAANALECAIDRLHDHLSRLIDRRPFVTLFAAGALSTVAMAPFHLWPVLIFTLPVLYWALEQAASASSPWRVAAWRGWAFGFGYHFAGLYWIGFSFLVQAERFAASMPFAITGLTAGLGLFIGLAGIAYALISRHLTGILYRLFLLALVMMAAEWLRGNILTGFPWNVLGYALTMPLPLMQLSSVIGIYGLTAITVIVLAAPLVLLTQKPAGSARPWSTVALLSVAPLASAFAFGVWQLHAHPTEFDDAVRIRLVQPSFTQKDKFDRSKYEEIFLRHLEMSQPGYPKGAAVRPKPTHIIWPEAAIPFFLRREPNALQAIDQALEDNVSIVAGGFRINFPPDVPNHQIKSYSVFNSALVVGGDGQIKSIYDKIHLVPFGEYLPAQDLLEALGFENLTRTSGGLAIGTAPRRLMNLPGLPPAAVLICYEASFPDDIVQTEARPGVLINLTNDAWFGRTSGPYQHFHQTRVRAVEQGLPMLRSANSGISAIVDPMGRVVARLGLDHAGVIDNALPMPKEHTLYAHFGPLIELGMFLGLLVVVAAGSTLRLWRH